LFGPAASESAGTLLLDGPQLASRWPCRYASVIADAGKRASRVTAHWNDGVDGVREIELAPGAAAVLITVSVEPATLWTADGRRHRDFPRLGCPTCTSSGRPRS
jgi:hypothetical protein